jgi:very-short-patch-repair endonuclease
LRTRELPAYVRQHQFAKETLGRRWTFDFAWPKYKLAVEIEGLVMRRLRDLKTGDDVWVVYGRHATIDGMRTDMLKYNSAGILGWTVLRFEQQMVKQGDAVAETMRFLYARGWSP